MHLTIHRGAHEIGGSCVEVSTASTRILLDLGMPLTGRDGKEFDFGMHAAKGVPELIREGILPDFAGLYEGQEPAIDGVILSHAHQDHFGLMGFAGSRVPFYMANETRSILELNNRFTPQKIALANTVCFSPGSEFRIGDLTVTPILTDHSAFGACMFLIRGPGGSLFYSGDFRAHGRRSRAFYHLLNHPPGRIDCLLMEGTNVGQPDKPVKSEEIVQKELAAAFCNPGKLVMVCTSGQNIDRLVSVYKACRQTGRTLAVDVYIANVLEGLSPFARIPHPNGRFPQLKVFFPWSATKKLHDAGQDHLFKPLGKYKVTKAEIAADPGKYVMMVRPTMQRDLHQIQGIEGGTLVWSQWNGYKVKPDVRRFLDYMASRGFNTVDIHTSGHAGLRTLQMLARALRPGCIIPIHTERGGDFSGYFGEKVRVVRDGERVAIGTTP